MRKIIYMISLLLAVLLVSCATKETTAPQPEPAPAETQEIQEAAEAEEPAETPEPDEPEPEDPAEEPDLQEPEPEAEGQDFTQLYAEVLDQNCDVIYNGIREDEEYSYVGTGVIESVMYMEQEDLLQQVGFTVSDLNGDGVPELLIGMVYGDETGEGAQIFDGYTIKDGVPVRFLEGWGRNTYQWLGDGRFFNFSSGGVQYSAFGSYRLSPDGTELVCEDLYFTLPSDSDPQEVSCFHNTTGSTEADESEQLDLSPDEFWQMADEMEGDSMTLELIPFREYDYTGYVAQSLNCKIRVDYLADVEVQYPSYEDASQYFDAPAGDYAEQILFQPTEEVRDFAYLSLSFEDVDDNGKARFYQETLFTLPVLEAGKPLAIPMDFPGDIPSNGFSYTDSEGNTRIFTVSISGRDGSLEVQPLD